MTDSYLNSAINAISNAAHAVAPSMFETKTAPVSSPSMRGKMVPNAPPMPTDEDLNKHYLSRDKTLENASHMFASAVNYVDEVATDIKAVLPSAEQLKTTIPAAIGLGPRLDENGIPIPPALPTREMTHGHYLIPLAPPLPTREMMHRHYLIPAPPPQPTKEMLNRHYLSRDKTLENASNILRSVGYQMSNYAAQLRSNLPSAADLGLAVKLDERGIPIPPAQPTREMMHKHYLIPMAPPLPTREMMNKHYLIPMAPPLPTKEAMNKHYLARNKTVENAQMMARSYVNYAAEVATDLKDAVVHSAPTLSTSSKIPAPPAQPTREMMHKHYLTRPAQRTNKAYAVDMSQQERAIVDNMYAPRQLETPAQPSPIFSINKMKRMAYSGASNLLSKIAPTSNANMSSQGYIPTPPPVPSREMMHKHYLIPLAPPLPTREMMNKHYLARNKTIENAGGLIHQAFTFVSEVAHDVKDYVMETPIEAMKSDVIEAINPTPVDESGIPIPPPLPSRQMMHKHYVIPLAPPLPKKDAMHRHYMSRDKTLENAGQSIRSAVTYAEEVVVDNAIAAKNAIVDGVNSIPVVVEKTGDIVSEKVAEAGDSLSSAANTVVDTTIAAKDAVVDGAIQLKEKVIPSQKAAVGVQYTRSEVISESPILKHKTAGARRIVARKDYSGFKPLLQ